jgi:multidrug efflux system outer membrane protein
MMAFFSRRAGCRCFFFVVFAAFSCAALLRASAQEPVVITLEEAVALALNADADLKKSAIDLGLSKTRAGSLWALAFPAISAGGGMSYKFPLDSSVKAAGPDFSVSAGIRLDLNAGLPYAMRSITLAHQQGLLNLEDSRRLITLAAAKSFYSLITQEQNLSVLENAKKYTDEQLERVTAAYRSGYRGELEYMQGRLSAEKSRLDYEKALAAYRSAVSNFCAVLGLDTENVRLSGIIETEPLSLDAGNLIAGYLPRRPDLAAKRSAVEKFQVDQKEKSLSARAPSLNLSTSWSGNLRESDNFAWSPGKTLDASLTLSIPINPWIPRTTQSQSLDSAAADMEKARITLKDAEDKARREIRLLCADAATRWNEVQLSRLQMDIAKRTSDLSEDAYRKGTIGYLDFESARGKFIEASQQFLTSELNYKLLILELASSLNITESELRRYSSEGGAR